MTSSPERTRRRTYARPPGKAAPRARRIAVIALALSAFALALYGFWSLLPAHRDAQAAQVATAAQPRMLGQHNATAARTQGLEAVRNNPDDAAAHVALARAYLALDQGIAAEAELNLATAAGQDPAMVQQWLAEALVLQGENERALVEVEKTDKRFRPYGLRVRAQALSALGNLAGANAAIQEAIRIAPNDSDVWSDAGRFRLTAGDVLGAIQAADKALALDPGNIDALVLRGQLVRGQFGLVAALPWFEAALKRDPWHHDALIEYAATLGEVGRTRDMLAATRRAIEARPGSPQAYYLQAALAARAGDYALARSLFPRTAGIGGVPGVLLLGATLDIDAGDYEQAIEKLKELVGIQPMNIAARRLLGLALLRTDAPRDALEILRPVVLRGDADAYAMLLVARGFERLGERNYAAEYLDRAAYPARAGSGAFAADDSVMVAAGTAAQRPGDPSAVLPYLRALIAAGDTDGALKKARAVARDNPGAPGAHLLLGDLLMTQERYGEAVTAYQRAADLRFDEPTMLRLVEALERSGRREEASNAVALFLSQNPRNVAALRLTGHWQLASAQYDDAVGTLEFLRSLIGDRDAALMAELAMAYIGTGDLDAARDRAEAAYALAPSNPGAADAYGWVLFRQGDKAGAVELLTKAAKLAPEHKGIASHLAQARAAR